MNRLPIAITLLCLAACSCDSDINPVAPPVPSGPATLIVEDLVGLGYTVYVDGSEVGYIVPADMGVYPVESGSRVVRVVADDDTENTALASLAIGQELTIMIQPGTPGWVLILIP